jgi:poly(A) polymerase
MYPESMSHYAANDTNHTEATGTEAVVARTLNRLREATRNSPYEGRLYLVGGLLRDRAMGVPPGNDLDLVLEGDAVALAHYLYHKGIAQHYPVTYPRFGTAMIHVADPDSDTNEAEAGSAVELVSARAESYHPDSRKPEVWQGTLQDDVLRRDFTINTLLENLHTGELLDLTGRAMQDLHAGIIRTPLEPRVTFFDDPLRMLRAIRFAARFGFEIEPSAWEAICAEAERLRPPAIAHERIREEFVKILKLPGVKIRRGMELLLQSNLLAQFLPEMLPMVGCEQGSWHRYDVWTHTLAAIEYLPDRTGLEVRLGLLWHDVGKPATRAEDERGVHFYGHPTVGTELTHAMMHRLKFSNDEIRDVTVLVEKHMRLGEYRPSWGDAPVKRLIRDCGAYLDDLFLLARCDAAGAAIPVGEAVDLQALRARIDAINAIFNAAAIESPLNGNDIMETLQVGQGIHLRDAKEFLTNEVIEGRLATGDKAAARELLRAWWCERKG